MNKALLALGICLVGCGGAQSRQGQPATTQPATAQPATVAQLDDSAMEQAREAVRLVDDGHASDAVPVFKRLLEKYPAHPILLTELAHAYLAADEPKQAIEVLTPLRGSKAFEVNQYVLLGSAFDATGDKVKALAAFDEGLANFPRAGELYTNAGITALNTKQFDKAISYFENGIAADPMHPSNYFFAADMYAESDKKMWALIYGEVFMNLERGTQRTERMSKILDDTFRRAVQIDKTSDGKTQISVSLNKVINTRGQPDAGDLPFEVVYELEVLKSVTQALTPASSTINLEIITKAREGFLAAWFADTSQAQQAYPLFLYQREVARAGHLDAYSHWLFVRGDEQEMTRWMSANGPAFRSFIAWFKDHPMSVTAQVARTRQ